MALPAPETSSHSSRVLTKATVRAARSLGLSQRVLAAVIGISESSASRLNRARFVDPESKEGELAILFLSVFFFLHIIICFIGRSGVLIDQVGGFVASGIQ